MPEEGLEPTPTCVERILNPSRLPFRHSGVRVQISRDANNGQGSWGLKRQRRKPFPSLRIEAPIYFFGNCQFSSNSPAVMTLNAAGSFAVGVGLTTA